VATKRSCGAKSRRWDWFVLASAREGCPNVVWEAMACGRPVVATRVGEVDRIVPDFAGILCSKGNDDDELLGCLRAALRGEWDAARIRAHAAQHTWEQVAERVAEEWKQALGEPEIARLQTTRSERADAAPLTESGAKP
jgi:glycosyltransferase involved in cell wall biosynthesis